MGCEEGRRTKRIWVSLDSGFLEYQQTADVWRQSMHMMGFEDTGMYPAMHMYFFILLSITVQMSYYQECPLQIFTSKVRNIPNKNKTPLWNACAQSRIRSGLGKNLEAKFWCTSSLRDKVTTALRLSLEISVTVIFVPRDTYCSFMLQIKVSDKCCVGDLQIGAEHIEAGLLSSCDTCVSPETSVESFFQKTRFYTGLRPESGLCDSNQNRSISCMHDSY